MQKISDLAGTLSFPRQRLDLLRQALTHPAFFEGKKRGGRRPEDNQRLEYLGDAVLDLLIGEYLYLAYPNAREGELSKMRAIIVCESSLAAQAKKLGLDEALLLGKGSELSGDRRRPSVLADAFEAVVGALFEAGGLEQARQFLYAQFKERMDRLSAEDYEDKKSLLQETVQKYSTKGVTYKLLDSRGPDHAPTFKSGAYWGKLLLASGTGSSKKESEQAAAQAALADKEQWLPAVKEHSPMED
ncbi:MAG: ribonuclease III [Firmicutes bacterium]|nr:ribonuclease III [Bacillota bacterium]